jgi:hypothetical protein
MTDIYDWWYNYRVKRLLKRLSSEWNQMAANATRMYKEDNPRLRKKWEDYYYINKWHAMLTVNKLSLKYGIESGRQIILTDGTSFRISEQDTEVYWYD